MTGNPRKGLQTAKRLVRSKTIWAFALILLYFIFNGVTLQLLLSNNKNMQQYQQFVAVHLEQVLRYKLAYQSELNEYENTIFFTRVSFVRDDFQNSIPLELQQTLKNESSGVEEATKAFNTNFARDYAVVLGHLSDLKLSIGAADFDKATKQWLMFTPDFNKLTTLFSERQQQLETAQNIGTQNLNNSIFLSSLLALVLTLITGLLTGLLFLLVQRNRRDKAALQKSQELYRIVTRNFPNGSVVLFDADLRYTLADGTSIAQAGLSLQGKTIWEAFSPSTCQQIEPAYRAALAGKSSILEVNVPEAGSRHTYLTHILPVKKENGEFFAGLVMTQDITTRKLAEQELAGEKRLLAVTLQSIGDGVITTDIMGNIVLINTVAQQLTGWTQAEAVNQPLAKVFNITGEKSAEAAATNLHQILLNNSVSNLANPTVLIAKDGTQRSISNSAAPIYDPAAEQLLGVVLVFRDVTEKQQMEQELLKTRKLESVGVLAGGIAHDFNNILAAIVGSLGLAKLEIAGGAEAESVEELLDETEKAAYRARLLTQQLLTFSKGGTPIRRHTSLQVVLEESVTFALRGSRAKYVFDIEPQLWSVEIDEGQINQVIHNLVINAEQAMPNGGVITIRAENVPTSERKPGLPLKNLDYVKLTIHDEGEGIPETVLPRIFDPYFTTKANGNGLGLATSFSIITKHEGLLTVSSELKKGTSFYIYLPAAAKASAKEILSRTPPGEMRSVAKNGRVLVIDDNPSIREIFSKGLPQFGYQVETVEEGERGCEIYKQALTTAQPYNLVILDVTIPGGLGGKEAQSRLKTIDPNVKTIVMSGYSNDPIMANYQEYGFVGVLVKPFTVTELFDTIKKVL